ncbi:hypothetical protein [Streptomyces mutomycini]|uniref:Uncharacterized protein n=1 Tax=Streptomyces mutomycini TaxID=284036 RepID=A0ABW0AYM6_9ACTN
MSQNLVDDFYALTSLVSPERVSRYLYTQGWDLVDRREGLLEEWAEPTTQNREVDSEIYLLPINEQYRDFARRFVEFLKAVADYYRIDAHELSHRLKLNDADVLLFRISGGQNSHDSVSLDEADGVLRVAQRMLKLSARYTASPGKEFTGRMKPEARQYIERNVTLGHTRRGSFVFPILSGPRMGRGADALFARRVVENLAIGLNRVASISEDIHSAVPDDFTPLVIALADSVHDLSRVQGLQVVDISFRWAPERGVPRHVPDAALVLESATIRQLGMTGSRVREILRGNYGERFTADTQRGLMQKPAAPPAPTAPTTEFTEISGVVIALQVDDRKISDWGTQYSIVIRSGTREGALDVQIPVSQNNYELATEAHSRGIMATAMGRLLRVNSGYFLEGEVIFNGELSR